MHIRLRVILGLFAGISIVMALLLGSPLGGVGPLALRNFCPLAGACLGGILTLVCTNLLTSRKESAEPWLRNERLAWNLIGLGLVAWAIGEAIWRYYRILNLNPFPSWADLGYSSYPPLVFAGLLLLPSFQSNQKRRFLIMDSLISVGAVVSIAWFLLLGSLAQTPAESALAKALGLYYPTTDAILLSCVIFLLLRGSGQAPARRISLLVAGIGLFILTVSDFNFNVQAALGTYVEGSWTDLGWPLGIMTIGLAAYLRCFLPVTLVESRSRFSARQLHFGLAQAVPYVLLVLLFTMLVFNVLSKDPGQESIRPILVIETMIVLGLVLVRQILTILDNARLVGGQKTMIKEMEGINLSIAERNALLETGITHLKDVQTRLANGDVRARAYITKGELWPLANGLNLMADRMMRSDHSKKDVQNISRAVNDFSQALEKTHNGSPLVIPMSCLHIPEMMHLIQAMGLKAEAETRTPRPERPQSGSLPSNPPPIFQAMGLKAGAETKTPRPERPQSGSLPSNPPPTTPHNPLFSRSSPNLPIRLRKTTIEPE